jgi:AhpD family alkylhydroperoxidase
MPAIPPRVAPGSRRQIGWVNSGLARLASREVDADRTLNVFTTIAIHRRLFRSWAMFARGLLRSGELDRREVELVILRVAHNSQCPYEWDQHVRIASKLGISSDVIESIRGPEPLLGGSVRREVLLTATDELHRDRDLTDSTWLALTKEVSHKQIIELCLLVGHYEMVAMVLNGLKVTTDCPAPSSPPLSEQDGQLRAAS